jgi:hypothetical protein
LFTKQDRKKWSFSLIVLAPTTRGYVGPFLKQMNQFCTFPEATEVLKDLLYGTLTNELKGASVKEDKVVPAFK